MSTLKVNAIEPYSGGSVSISGSSTSNGPLTVNGTSQLNGAVTVPNTTVTVTNTANSGRSIIGNNAVGLKTYNADGTLLGKVETGFGGSIGFYNNTTTDDFGFTMKAEEWGYLGDWTGPALSIDNPSGNYPTIIGFQNKATWTDGRVTFLTPIVLKSGATIEGLGDYVDDAAAATGGVAVNGVYRTGSVLKIRVS